MYKPWLPLGRQRPAVLRNTGLQGLLGKKDDLPLRVRQVEERFGFRPTAEETGRGCHRGACGLAWEQAISKTLLTQFLAQAKFRLPPYCSAGQCLWERSVRIYSRSKHPRPIAVCEIAARTMGRRAAVALAEPPVNPKHRARILRKAA